MFDNTLPSKTREVLSVSQINRKAKQLLETHLSMVWIEGEISNFATPSSGHWYLTLKDEQAQVRCAMFNNRNARLRFKPENGMHVVVRGRVSLYEGRGDYQIILEHMELAGEGALQKAFEELKQKLAHEGLFASEHKKSLPHIAQHIGIITSPTGAAIHDILTVMRRRFAGMRATLIPSKVQGEEAAREIVHAIQLANTSKLFDAVILTRGGGSLEDLWPFNEEIVARAIYQSAVPIISAVCHEIDFTIADFVADVRAPTPSAAAELITPDAAQWLALLRGYEHKLDQCMKRKINEQQQRLDWLVKRLKHPGSRLVEQAQRLDDMEMRLKKSMRQHLAIDNFKLATLTEQLKQFNPSQKIGRYLLTLNNLDKRLHTATRQQLKLKQQQLTLATQMLDAVSPLATLTRGYAIVSDTTTGKIVNKVDQINCGDKITTRLSDGSLTCVVQDKAQEKGQEGARE